MLQVDPLLALLIVQFLLIFAGLTIFMIIKYRKLSAKEVKARREAHILDAEVIKQGQINDELKTWKVMFNDLQEKFEGIRIVNEKLKNSLAALIPEAERTKEFEQLIVAFEQNNETLDNCIGSLKKENEDLESKVAALEREAEGLADLLQQTVRREELDRALEQKQAIKLKHEKAIKGLDQLRTEHENLQKQYAALKKEFDALYDNIEVEKTGV